MTRPIPKSNAERAEWLRKRTAGVGGSDAAIILGLSKWKTAFELYHEKLGLKSLEMTEAQRWGLIMEPVICEEYERATGRPLVVPDEFTRHPDRAWQFANLDRFNPNDRIVEAKQSRHGDGFGERDSDQIPDYYLVQVTHQMVVSGYDVADLAVLIGGNDFRIYTVPFNKELADTITEAEAAFWECVREKSPPVPDWQHPTTLDAMKRIFPPTEGRELVIPTGADDYIGWCESYRKNSEAIKALEAKREEAKAKLIYVMDGATTMSLPDGTKVVRKITQTGREYWRVGEPKE